MAWRKAFMLRIEIDIHSVHCQEIRLCHSGNIALRVHSLNSTAVTMPACPSFPIHFREKLIFEKVIDCVTTLAEVQDHLNKESLQMELVQWPRHYSRKPTVIAHFRTKLSSLLFPTLVNKDLVGGGDIKLLMEPTEMFAGSSGPKVEVSTKTIVEETTSHRPSRTRLPEQDILCSSGKAQAKGISNCCRHNLKSQLPTCGCQSTDHCRRKPRSRHKRTDNSRCRWSQVHETSSCNDCCICNCYSGYFDPKPYLGYRSRSCSCVKTCEDLQKSKFCLRNKHVHLLSPLSLSSSESCTAKSKFTSSEVERQIPYRQRLYDNLDFFYRQLRDKKSNRNYI